MKKYLVLLCAFAFLFGLSGAAHAYSLDFTYNTTVDDELISPFVATTEDFDGALLSWGWTGSGAVVNDSEPGKYAAPAGVGGEPDASDYLTVPEPTEADHIGSYRAMTLGGTYNYFGLWWGSIDAYNTLTFYLDGNVVEIFTGDDVIASSTFFGDQYSPNSNRYVNFLGLSGFDSFELSSTEFAFEADNIAIGVVPEPTTMLLLGLGLVGLAGIRRKL